MSDLVIENGKVYDKKELSVQHLEMLSARCQQNIDNLDKQIADLQTERAEYAEEKTDIDAKKAAIS